MKALNRRSLLALFASAGVSIAALSPQPVRANLHLHGQGVAGALIVAGNAVGTAYPYAPLLLDTTIHRTILVPQDADYIDLQGEIAHPGSPVISSWSIGGADAGKFHSTATNQISLTAAARAALVLPVTLQLSAQAVNAYGASVVVAINVIVPTNANCRFVSYVSGNDANNGTTPALAWQHVPRQFDFTGTQVTLGAGQVLFFKAESHRTFLAKTNAFNSQALDHTGVSGNPFIYCGRGWGGQAALDGSNIVSGWASVTSGEVFGNPNFANITKITSSAVYWQHLYDDQTMCFPAQWPTPSDLFEFDNVFVDQVGGMWRIPAANGADPGGTTAMWQTAANGDIHIRDPRIAARYGNISLANMPPLALVWAPGNNVSIPALGSYDYPTSTITVTGISGLMNAPGNVSAYALYGHPLDIVLAGQYADFGGNRYAWQPNGGVTSISTRTNSVIIQAYVTYEGLCGQRYCGNGNSLGAIWTQSLSGTYIQTCITACKVAQNRANSSTTGIALQCTGSGGMIDAIFERNFMDQNVLGRIVNLGGGPWNTALVAPTPAQVRAYPYGKLRWNYINNHGAGRTLFDFTSTIATGIHILGNIATDVNSVHGNGISIYNVFSGSVTASITGTALTVASGTTLAVGDLLVGTGVSTATFVTGVNGGGSYNVTPSQTVTSGTVMSVGRVNESYFVIEQNFFDNITLPVTTSISSPDGSIARNHLYTGNVFLAYGGDARSGSSLAATPALDLFAGEPGSTFSRNIAMMGRTSVYGGPGAIINNGLGITLKNNVISGIEGTAPYQTLAGGTVKYDIENNLLMVNDLVPDSPPGQVASPNTISAVAPTRIWDYVISAEMAAALGSGQIGLFWNVP